MTERGGAGVRGLVAAAALAAACGTPGEARTEGAGRAAAAGLVAALDQAATVRAPWRCARPRPAAGGEIATGARRWTRDGAQLTSVADTLTIAAVADARGAADPAVREAIRAAGADLVIAAGGMGTTEAELGAALGALVDPAWLVVAVPGTTEAWPAHRAAIARLIAGGAAIADGSDVRLIDAGAAVIATLPGLPYVERLAAGAEGCSHDDADVARAVAELARVAAERPTVLAAARAPQGGPSDATPGGLHAGDPELAAAAAAVNLVIHAPLDGAATARGQGDGADHHAVAAGSLDGVPRRALDGTRVPRSLTIVRFDRRGRAWRAVMVR